jgi:hypothetical protein
MYKYPESALVSVVRFHFEGSARSHVHKAMLYLIKIFPIQVSPTS